MTIFYLSTHLSYIRHTLCTEIVKLSIRSRFMITTLICSLKHSCIRRNNIVFQLTHRLKLHTCDISKCFTRFMQSMFRRTFQWLSVFIEERTKHRKCRYFCKRINKSGTETRHYIQVATPRLYKRKQAGTVHPLSTSKDRIQISRIINYKIQCFQSPVSGRIHEIDHTDIILLNKRNNICLSKLGGRLFQSSHQTVRIH